jgi:Mrp family chromosome partitioning ATPase
MLTVKQIGMIDATMRGLLSEQSRLEDELGQLQLRLGSAHPTVKGLKISIDQAKEKVAQYADEFREYQSHLAQSPEAARQGPMSMFVQPVEVLQANREVLTRIVAQARQEVATLSSKRDEAEALKALVYKTRQSLSEVQDRKDMLSLEMQLGDRLEITSLGQVPLSPYRDTRWRIAAVGVIVGGAFPAALLAIFGLSCSRYRYSDEARKMAGERRLPLLGVLPLLQPRRLSEESAADAAQCVHQIRVMLQGGVALGPRAFLISSASPREGKTSLCLALGLSFTASGARTLVIDADLVGRGLTRGLRAEGVPGFLEALRTGRLSATERPDGLSVLTAGDSDAGDASRVSSQGIRRLLDEARRQFDTILIDSGPILGSVEATVTAREVDGVIVTIARGQEPSVVERALQHLDALGAKVVGAVFNRARIQDFYRSFRSSSSRAGGTWEKRDRMRDRTPFGPLVDSVVLSAGSGGR